MPQPVSWLEREVLKPPLYRSLEDDFPVLKVMYLEGTENSKF